MSAFSSVFFHALSRRRLVLMGCFVFSIGLMTPLSHAGESAPSSSTQLDAERQRLALLVGQLDQLIAQVDDAAKQSKRVGRITFQYDALRADLTQVRGAIQHHVNETTFLPRPVAPLNLQYSR